MGKSILVVDDNQFVRAFMSKMLEASGFETRQAADGAEAFQMAVASPPDLVVADYTMPKMNGADLVRAIRSSTLRALPVLAVASTQQSESEMLEAGANMYLSKPIDEPRLISSVCSLLHLPMNKE